MTQKSQTALQKMQDIASRLISNTPELAKMLEADSVLRPKKPLSPVSKKKHFSKEMTANDYYEKCKELNQELQSMQDKYVQLQEELKVTKERFVERQIQYRTIIEQLQSELKSKSSLDSTDRNRMLQINDMHKQIIDNIGSIQNKTSKILIEQQCDIRRFFNKKITQIKEKFKEDKQNKNQKDQQYQQKEKHMISQLEWVKNIAHKIDEENKSLMKKYAKLKADYDLLTKDKEMLLKQLLANKKQNAILKSQVEQYQTLLSEVSKQMEEPKQVSEKQKQSVASQSRVNAKNNSRVQNTVIHLQKVIEKQKNKIRRLKTLYMKEISSKSQLENVLRSLVDQVREKVVNVQKKKDSRLSEKEKNKLLQQILEHQKILTLIYDKTFYVAPKLTGLEPIPNELAQILEEEQGFH